MTSSWKESVVPITVKCSQLEIEGSQFGIGDFDAGRVAARIQFGADFQSRPGARANIEEERDRFA